MQGREERQENETELNEKVVAINRVAKVVKDMLVLETEKHQKFQMLSKRQLKMLKRI